MITKLCTSLVEATGLRDDLIDNAVVGVPEVSGLGDAAVLTGALAVGLGIAQESVFANRRAAGSAALDPARG